MDAIVVRASDDFKVTSVKVSVYSPAGILLEEGDAAINANGLDRTYTASVINDEVAGSGIKAIALDTPGNSGSLEVIL